MVLNLYDEHATMPPWPTAELWIEATSAIAAAASRPGIDMTPVAALARCAEQCIAELDGIMGVLCAASCPGCRQNCCHRATVWYDFKELIFLHILGMMPKGQIVRPPQGPCPHLGRLGCALPRMARPYICTWYLCPDLQAAIQRLPADIKIDFSQNLARLKPLRQQMENAFVAAVTG